MSDLRIDNVQFASAPRHEQSRGLIGWVSCTMNDTVKLAGLTLRRTLEGRLALSFPSKRDSQGREHFIVRPLDDATRRKIEREIFTALGLEKLAT